MNLKVLGSGSSGNCYVLENETEALVIEAGLPLMEVKKALDFNIKKIEGLIESHSHGDHHKYWYSFSNVGVPVFEPFKGIDDNVLFKTKHFKVQAFPLVHDVPCYGFYIQHKEIGKLLYITDTEHCKYNFKKQEINHILVEANYSDEILEKDAINREHVMRGHMSLETTLEFLKTNDNPTLKNVVLIHLSNKNSNPDEFLKRTKEIVSNNVNTYIAEKGLNIALSLVPF